MFKARMMFSKTGRAAYISHLDLMHCMQRVMARAETPVWFTEGFNPHAYVSVALPLSTGFESECEFLDFNLLPEAVPEGIVEKLNAFMPEGLKALKVYPVSEGKPVRDIAWCRYEINLFFDGGVPEGYIEALNSLFSRPEVRFLKRTKRGESEVNLKDLMREYAAQACGDGVKICAVTAAGGQNLSPEYLTRAAAQYLPEFQAPDAAYRRLSVYDKDFELYR